MPFCELKYKSATLQKATSVHLILPAPEVPKPYHLLLLLHGLSDDSSIWSRRTSIERYVEGWPLAVAMPDAGRSFYCDAAHGPRYLTAIGKELPALLRSYFPLRKEMATAGLSMGGYGAIRLALEYPQRFKVAASLSGALGFGHRPDITQHPLIEEFRLILGDQVIGGPNDLFARSKKAGIPKLYLNCGTDDGLLDDNRSFHRHLKTLGLDHVYVEAPGGHTWDYWDLHVQEALSFIRSHLGA